MAYTNASPWRKLVLIVLIVILTAGVAGFRVAGDRLETLVKARLDRMIADYSAFVTIDYGRIGVGVFGQAIRVTGVSIVTSRMEAPLRIGELVIHRSRGGKRIPHQLTVSAKSVNYPGLRASLEAYFPDARIPAIDPANADIFLDYVYDPDAHTFLVRRLTIHSPGMGTVSLAAGLSNIVLENAALYLIMPYSLNFDGFTLVYSDGGLVSRLFKIAAAERKMAPADAGQALKENLRRAGEGGDPAIAGALGTLAIFLDRPDHLILDARPEKPVPITGVMRLKSFEEFVKLLDVRIEANKY